MRSQFDLVSKYHCACLTEHLAAGGMSRLLLESGRHARIECGEERLTQRVDKEIEVEGLFSRLRENHLGTAALHWSARLRQEQNVLSG